MDQIFFSGDRISVEKSITTQAITLIWICRKKLPAKTKNYYFEIKNKNKIKIPNFY